MRADHKLELRDMKKKRLALNTKSNLVGYSEDDVIDFNDFSYYSSSCIDKGPFIFFKAIKFEMEESK